LADDSQAYTPIAAGTGRCGRRKVPGREPGVQHRRTRNMNRVFNFSAGPAMLPEAVLRRAQAELLDWKGSGMSVMEVSHRGADFIEFAAAAERRLRGLLRVPDHYKVLFMAGGATAQFAAVPLNIAPEGS